LGYGGYVPTMEVPLPSVYAVCVKPPPQGCFVCTPLSFPRSPAKSFSIPSGFSAEPKELKLFRYSSMVRRPARFLDPCPPVHFSLTPHLFFSWLNCSLSYCIESPGLHSVVFSWALESACPNIRLTGVWALFAFVKAPLFFPVPRSTNFFFPRGAAS